MGTRTYSRRRADGTRVPTALGRATGKFTGETGGAGGTLIRQFSDRTRFSPAMAGIAARDPELAIRLANADLGTKLLGGAQNPWEAENNREFSLVNGVPTRQLVGEDVTSPQARQQMLEIGRILDDRDGFVASRYRTGADGFAINANIQESNRLIQDSLGGVDERTLNYEYPRFTSIVATAIGTQRLSLNNAERIAKATRAFARKIPADATPEQRRALHDLIDRAAGLAAERSQVYDQSIINPSAPVGQGDFSGRLGRPLQRRADAISQDIRRVARAINQVLGQPTGNINPPRGTFGAQMMGELTSPMGTAAHQSSLKMARERAPQIAAARQALGELYPDTPLRRTGTPIPMTGRRYK